MKRTGQNNVHRSCRVIWSDVGYVCPTRSFGVDKVCLSQYLDGLFAYFLLGRSEMLVSGHSIFQCSSWGLLKNSMCWCSCQLAYNLLHSFQLPSWGWVWMVLRILMLFSSFYYTAGELKTISKSSGAIYFVSRFRLIRCRRSQTCCGCSFHWVSDVTDCCCCWKVVLCRFGISELSAWSG